MDSEVNMKGIMLKHLRGGEAFMPLEEILKKIPFSEIGKRPAGLPYSFYEIFYHIKFTQNDILEYCIQKNYKSPEWPRDYWPDPPRTENENSWDQLKSEYFKDREELEALVLSKETDLLETVPSGGDHTFMREILLVIEHTAYHSGQLLILLRHLGLHSS
jgi:uncharacterized damage-inducible protein DinB